MNLAISSRDEFLSGVRDELPILIGVIPFGMIYGVLGLQAGLPVPLVQSMSAIIFAGSAQFIITGLAAQGVSMMVIILTGVVVNLRHLLYSASVAPYLKQNRPAWKTLLAYLLTDEAYAVTILHFMRTDTPANESTGKVGNHHWYFLGAGLTLWTGWQLSTMAGIFLGAQFPASWSLDFAGALTFLALLMPTIVDQPSLAAALAAGVSAVLLYNLPYRLGLLGAAVIGTAVGLILEKKA